MENVTRRPLHVGINAHLLSGQAGYRSAGIHGYIYNLLRHLPAADPDARYTVFVGVGRPALGPRLTVRAARLRTDRPALRVLWEQLIQPGAARRAGVDLLHALAFVAPLVAPCPSVVTVYDLSFLYYPERFRAARRLYLRALTGVSCRRARRVIAISQSTARDVHRLLGVPAERIDVAAPGVSEDFFAPVPDEVRAAFRADKNLPARFILSLGTLEPRKNLLTLLHAYAKLPSRDVKLVLAGGKGWLYDDIFRAIETLDLKDDVILPGYVPGIELPRWYASAETFVYPSIYEGFGLPLLEAMAAGTPVIASNTSSLPEAVGDVGALVAPDDVEAWTAALARAVDSPAWRAEMGARGRAHARTFTWARTAVQTVDSYRRALERK
ncbi:MAG: glycosyltransferase family 4 protein [Anaerolineae bacterium]|nr:glycosyltransferase family 4 protein [Anaerolineae bacterium]